MTDEVLQKQQHAVEQIRNWYLTSWFLDQPYLLWSCPVCGYVWPTWREDCHNCYEGKRPEKEQWRFVHPEDLHVFAGHEDELEELEARKRVELEEIPSVEEQWLIVAESAKGLKQ